MLTFCAVDDCTIFCFLPEGWDFFFFQAVEDHDKEEYLDLQLWIKENFQVSVFDPYE